MKLNKVSIIIISAVVGLILVAALGFALREPIKDYINGIRVGRLEARATEAFAAEKWDEASRLGQAAYYIDNDNRTVQLIVARSLLNQRMASASEWWKLVINEPDLPVDELRLLTTALLQSGRVEDGIIFLKRLVELDGENPQTQRLWISFLRRERRYGKAMELATRITREGSDDWAIHQEYLVMNDQLGGGDSRASVISHLEALLKEGGPLAMNAARELIILDEVTHETRLAATAYMREHKRDDVDVLYAASAEVKEGVRDEADIYGLLESLLDDPEEGVLEEVLDWAAWMNALDWFAENVAWEDYIENGGSRDAYLDLLLRVEDFNQLIDITERFASESDDQATPILYYRSVALHSTGNIEEAQETLRLSVQTVDPENTSRLEILLIRDGHWSLLTDLYDILMTDDPDNSMAVVKAISAHYYTGQHDDLIPLLDRIEYQEFDDRPDIESFLIYLNLLRDGYDPGIHGYLENQVAKYPEVFDFRLVLGVSYVLQGRANIGQDLLVDMPILGMNAPRYIRIASVILGKPERELIAAGEYEYLMPRERYLISLLLE